MAVRLPSLKKRKAPDHKEWRLHTALVEHLTRACCRGVFWFHPANDSRRSARQGARLKAMGMKAGVGDLVLIAVGAPPLMLELKAAKGKQTESQRLIERHWKAAGGQYEVATGIDEAIAALVAYGALPEGYAFVPSRRLQGRLALEAA